MKKIKEQAPQSAQFELFFQKVKAEKFETFLPSVTNYVQLKQAAGLYDPLSMAAKDALIQACVSQVLSILENQKER